MSTIAVNSSVTIGTTKFILKTTNDDLLKLESDNSISLNGTLSDFDKPSVQFYVDITSKPNVTEDVFLIRPVSNSLQYLAVSGKSVVLKGASQVSDNSHFFIEVEQPDNIHTKLQVYTSPSSAPTFISSDNKGGVFIAGDSAFDSQRAWFNIEAVFLNSAAKAVNAPFVTSEFMVSEE